MTEKIYFDYNIINYLRQSTHQSLDEKFSKLNEETIIAFSPAHLEEIAVSEKRENVDASIINEEIDFLTKIAKNNSLRPVTREKLVLFNEYPLDCYKRVISQYESNDLAEIVEKEVIRDANEYPLGDPRSANNISPSSILGHINHRELIALSLFRNGIIDRSEMVDSLRWSFLDLKDRFFVFESYVNSAANLLEKLGYYREVVDKSRSRLHDVSHIIYAAYCDIFVSGDKKLLKKTKAIYSMLNVPTKVLDMDEFIKS